MNHLYNVRFYDGGLVFQREAQNLKGYVVNTYHPTPSSLMRFVRVVAAKNAASPYLNTIQFWYHQLKDKVNGNE